MRNPYLILGIDKSASEQEIKSAYRKLAKAYHPDQNKDDPHAEAKFAEVTSAYELLSDKQKRSQFDRGEIDAAGNSQMGGFNFGDFGGFARNAHGSNMGSSAEDILREFMGNGGGFANMGRQGHKVHRHTAPKETQVTLTVSLEEVALGGKVPVILPDGSSVTVTLPKHVENGQQIRLRGRGPVDMMGRPCDVIATVRFNRHPLFRTDGADLRVDVPITLYEAVLGGKIRVPTLSGPVDLSVPPGVDPAKALRMKGKGMPKAKGHGDIYIHLRITLPEGGDADLESMMRFWRDNKPYIVRKF